MNNLSDTARVIVVSPQGLLNPFNQASWNNGTQFISSTANDLGFFNAMMDLYLEDFNADITSIYVTGFSMGGIMSHHLACKLNHRIAAIGSMAGTIATSNITYHTSNPLEYKTPVIHLHGTADGTVPYDVSPLPSLSLVPETMDFWKGVHGCADTYDSIRQPDTAADGITVDQFIYNSCDLDGPLELWRLNNADHVYLYQPVNDITEAIEIWLFLRNWHHPSASPVSVGELNTATIDVFPNPSNGKVTVYGLTNSKITIYSANGIMMGEFSVNASQEIDLTSLTPGVYFMDATEFASPLRIILQ
jgi:polyhydroxybutyrate depolymerase